MYKYEVEFLVCRMDQTWFTYEQEIPFSFVLNTENNEDFRRIFLPMFAPEGDFAYIGIYNVTQLEEEETPPSNLDIVLDALTMSVYAIELDQLNVDSEEVAKAYADQLFTTNKAITIIEALKEENI